MKVQLDTLKSTILTILSKSGYSADEAQTVMDVLLYAQLRGNNQGIVKLIGAGMPKDKAAVPNTIVRETKLSALIDGGRTVGMVVLKRATQLAIEKATEHGIGIVGTRNTFTSTGAIGYYAGLAAKQGLIGLVFAGSGEFVSFYGSYEPLFGTNPLAIGIPTKGDPIVFDMATAAIARYGVVEAKTAGRSIPGDVAYDAQGQLTTDPVAALAGAIRTFGGYKGAALALMVEVLTGQLVGTSRDANGHKTDWGNLALVIDPEVLIDRDEFATNVSQLVERLKNAKRLPGTDEILLPGDRGNAILAAIEASGEVEIEDQLWSELQKAAQ